jgi:hypothetical protein
MILSDDQIQELKSAITIACEERLGEEIDEVVRYAIKEYGDFEENDLPKLKEVAGRIGYPIEDIPERFQELRNRAYEAERELHEIKTAMEQKRHWMPLVRKLRDILASQNQNDLVAMIDNYILTGQL